MGARQRPRLGAIFHAAVLPSGRLLSCGADGNRRRERHAIRDLGPYLGAPAHLFIASEDAADWDAAKHDHGYAALDFRTLDELSHALCDDVSRSCQLADPSSAHHAHAHALCDNVSRSCQLADPSSAHARARVRVQTHMPMPMPIPMNR